MSRPRVEWPVGCELSKRTNLELLDNPPAPNARLLAAAEPV
jgi:uncharacterized protein (DUF1778 family)